ncbi:AaceriAGR225WAp [[Ashbya] aceris (nom. inval.)]|nr:AaceriAGR225WAp [[Ashbya] aceris (nom. inval.)]
MTQNAKSIIIGVVIPLVAIVLVLGVALGKAWHKQRKEDMEDHDPDFDGDAEFVSDLASGGQYTPYKSYPEMTGAPSAPSDTSDKQMDPVYTRP